MSSAHLAPVEGRREFAPWLLEPMRRNRSTYLKVAAAAAMINIFGLVTSLFTMTVYDRVVPNNATASLVALSIGMAVVVVFDFVLRLLRAYFVDIAGARIDHEVGQEVFGRLLRIRLETRRGSTGALTGLMRELETLREFFASATLTAIVDVPFIVITILLIGIIGGPVVIVPCIMVPIVILSGWLTHPALDRLSSKVMNEGLSKQSVLVETIGALETVKATGAGGMLSRRWGKAIHGHSDSSLRQRLISTISVTIATSANTICYAAVVVVGVGLIAENKLTSGALIACSILSSRAVAPLGTIAQLLSRITATRTAYRQLQAVMVVPPEGPGEEALKPGKLAGAIEFRNVAFRYPGATERTLDGVNFTIGAGEHVAILGRVGSGKSTIAKLILGLYPPEDGLIMVDGIDIRQLDPEMLRANIGAALQESVLFTGSVRENILLGRPGVDDEGLLHASTLSGSHQFMGQIANGYDLKLADRGEGLSGGQRQSIALARALATKPPVVLLDEPTSSMDQQTEQALVVRLRDELAGRTLVIVTHRPPLLALVDRIILLDRGKVVLDGPRDAVLAQINSPRVAPGGPGQPGGPGAAPGSPAAPRPPQGGPPAPPASQPKPAGADQIEAAGHE